jgi:glycogen operon protein
MFLALLLFAHGTPMLQAGDEMGRTQQGNNNAYCQDNEISWLDWDALTAPAGDELCRFTARLLAIRRSWTALRGGPFMHGHTELLPGIRDIAWYDENGNELSPDDWNNPEGRLLALRRAARSGADRAGPVGVTLLLINGSAAAGTRLAHGRRQRGPGGRGD